ncbi:Uncharacterised_protein family UPF0538 [Hexamita inflata]|uniref:Uncharacterized_protein family UPF0538 n=1 Tax=Hexamita inflata TaxID=28002 RepID=A0AA86P176_9EUKA|nr:Uncharacterised protein family UPF0538 [Hexamita inflata]
MIVCCVESFEKQKGHYLRIVISESQTLNQLHELVINKVQEVVELQKLRSKINSMTTFKLLRDNSSNNGCEVINMNNKNYSEEDKSKTIKELGLNQNSIVSLFNNDELDEYTQKM